MALDKSTMDEQNLGFLKRRDPDAEQILGSSAHVTMYIMSVESQKWERRNVEGTLYVVKRRTNPRFQMVVLNKLSTENYVETIETGFHAEVSPPYLIYTQGGGKVHGVWFYEEADLQRIAALLLKVEAGLPKPAILPPEPTQADAAATVPASDDGGFWDKPRNNNAPAPPPLPEMLQAQPAPPTGNALTNLFKNIHIKQQTPPAPHRPEVVVPPSLPPPASAVPALPPAFFQTPSAPANALVNKNLDHLRTSAALSPAHSADMAGAGSFSTAAAAAVHDNPISKLFNKQPLQTASAPTPNPTPTAPGPPPAPMSNTLAALFNNATIKSQSLVSSSAPAPGSAPHQPVSSTPSRTANSAAGHPANDRLRTALSRLVVRDEFINLLSEELRNVGLL